MKIALIGFGAMGKLIKTLAENKNHEIAVVIDESDANLSAEVLAEKLKGADAVIDFSVAEAVERNVRACLLAEIPLVQGTTGWNAQKIRSEIRSKKQTARSFSGRIFRSVLIYFTASPILLRNFLRNLTITKHLSKNAIIRGKKMRRAGQL